MSFDITNVVRKQVLTMIPYQSARRIGYTGTTWLNANELPMSMSLTVKLKDLNRYPEFQSYELINKYSDYVGCLPEQILVTRGADEGIDLLMRVFCEPGVDAIISCPPTYDMYNVCAAITGVKNKICNMGSDWNINVSLILSNIDKVKLIYLCHPNNPTGNLLQLNDIKSILNGVGSSVLVVIDEAYIEFALNYSVVSWISEFPNLIVLRTLSKSFGLAGIRCGFTIAHSSVIQMLSKVIAPYPLSTPVIDIALCALNTNNIQLMKDRVDILMENKYWLINKLNNISIVERVFLSFTNYILVKFISCDSVFNYLIQQGVVLRNQNKKLHLTGCIRITIGTREECEYLIKLLQKISS
ncbi:MAG: histidinol-phosphate transaminase [Buchnera aphidicola (Eriosoma harunire)]